MSNRMDKLFHDAAEAGVIARVDENGKKEGLPPLFVAPLGTVVPDDGLLAYVTVDKFADIVSAEAGSVVLFRKDQARMLFILSQDADMFGFDVKALMGLPSTEYEQWFDEATFSRDKVSYAPLISEIRIADEVDAAKAANRIEGTTHLREQKRISRGDGSVRYHENIGVYKPEDAADVEEEDEAGAGQV